jgi:hypothetical protein
MRRMVNIASSGRRSQANWHRLVPLKIGLSVVFCVLGFLIVADLTLAGEKPFEASINAFLDLYFSSWSNRDMHAYRNCFHPKATIVFLDRTNALHTSLSLDAFIRSQEEAHQKSTVKMREVPLDKQITVADKVGQGTVRWKLFKGHQTVTGVDLFTLVFTAGQWKILQLAVRND